jgi:Ca2+-transporting ATPase
MDIRLIGPYDDSDVDRLKMPTPMMLFPYLAWIMAGWALTWAAMKLQMLQRLLDTVSLTSDQWLVVLGLSLVAPALVAADATASVPRPRAPAS